MWSYTLRIGILNRMLINIGGAAAVTAFAIQYEIDSFVSAITIGVGINTLMLSGIFYGEGDVRSLQDTLRTSLRTGLILSIATASLIFVFAPQLAGIFSKADAASNIMNVRAIRFFSASFPLSLVSAVFINYYQVDDGLLAGISGGTGAGKDCGLQEGQFPMPGKCFNASRSISGTIFQQACPYCGIWTSLPEGVDLAVAHIFECAALGYVKRVKE